MFTGLCTFHSSGPMQEDGLSSGRSDAPRGLTHPRWVEVQPTYGPERPQGRRTEIYFHRLPPSRGILHLPPWERVVAPHDQGPEELGETITGWFYDLWGQSPNVEWWVRRVHEAAASSRMPLLQHVNCVLITRVDFHAFARKPHGLMVLAFQGLKHPVTPTSQIRSPSQ